MLKLGNDNTYTFEERQLIMIGMGLGMSTLAEMLQIPDKACQEAVNLVRASMKENVPEMDCSKQEITLIKDNPSKRWSQDFEKVMKGIHKRIDVVFHRVGDEILDGLDKDIVDYDKNDPEEVEAVEGLKAMKDYLAAKGYTDIGTTKKLLDTFSKLPQEQRLELAGIMEGYCQGLDDRNQKETF